MPASENTIIPDQFDIDIKPENMDQEHKEILESLNMDNKLDNLEGDYEELEDNFILLANGGEIPIDLKRDLIDNKHEEEKKKENPLKKAGPSYKYITKEECEFLDKKFKSTYEKDYKMKENSNNKDPDINYISKEKFEEAIEELVPSTVKNKTILNENDEDFEEYEDYDDYPEEDEFEEYEDPDITEFVVKSEDKIKNEPDLTLKIKNEENKKFKKQKEKITIKQNQDSEGGIDLETFGKLAFEKTIALFEANFDEEAGNEELFPNVKEYKLDITHVEHSLGNNPKIIYVEKNPTKKSKEIVKKDVNEEKNVTHSTIETIPNDETKDQKKLRKKLVKDENKSKRIEKKKLKEAYKVNY